MNILQVESTQNRIHKKIKPKIGLKVKQALLRKKVDDNSRQMVMYPKRKTIFNLIIHSSIYHNKSLNVI